MNNTDVCNFDKQHRTTTDVRNGRGLSHLMYVNVINTTLHKHPSVSKQGAKHHVAAAAFVGPS